MRRFVLVLLVAVLCSLISRDATAATYYVSPSGDDSGGGSITVPWRTVAKAARGVSPGDTVYFRDGSWNERLVPGASGAEGAMITFAAYPGEDAVFDGTGVTVGSDSGLIDLTGRSFIRVSGLRVLKSSDTGIYAEYGSNIIIEDCRTESTQGSGIGIWGSSHVLIDGNEVIAACINGMQEHITVAGTDDFEVRNNRIHDTAPGTNGKEGICTKDGSSNGTVHHNEIYNLKRPGIYVDAWDKHTFNIRLYANRVHDVQADGFAIASELGGQLENIVVENNLSYDNMVGIVISFCCEYGGPLHPLKNVTIINNTCVRNGYDPWGGGIAVENEQIEGVVIRNNLVSGSFTFQLAANASLPVSKLVIDHNLISNFLDGEGETRGTDCVEGDPRFRDGSSDDFHLQPGSPAIDAGSEASAPANDYDGKSRPRDGNGDGVAASDIGAFESYSVRRRPARR